MWLWTVEEVAAPGNLVSFWTRPLPWLPPSVYDDVSVASPSKRHTMEICLFVDLPDAMDAFVCSAIKFVPIFL